MNLLLRPRAQPRPRQRPDRRSDMLRGAAVAVVVLGTVVSGLTARGWQETIARQRDDRLDRSASTRKVTIEGAMANYENALQAARSLWVASDSVSRKEFNAFARSLDLRDRYSGLQGIGWRSFVTDGDRAWFLARARADDAPGLTIRPPGRRPVYYVTLFSYPRIPSSSTLGADARADPGIYATLDQARDTGKATVSNQTTLAGDLDLPARERPVAFELFVPVYRYELRPDASVAQRRRTLDGWATGQFRAQDFLDAAMKPWRSQASMGVELYDEAVPDGGPLASWPKGFQARGPDVQQERFSFGGRTFALRFAPLPGSPVLTDRTVPPTVVLVVGSP
jgi:CHASE1-domain containing sensor protein